MNIEQELSKGEKELIAQNLMNAITSLYLVKREYHGLTLETHVDTMHEIQFAIAHVETLRQMLITELKLPRLIDTFGGKRLIGYMKND